MKLKIGDIVKITIPMFSSITYYEEVVGFEGYYVLFKDGKIQWWYCELSEQTIRDNKINEILGWE